ncbi:probable serine/threonine-protein kinase DDB_G0282963 [Wyeomyia smithii]|uniref:probable serine/threonine-protein kinase DDB_G0282963 n=1 Tax=Wyeomyia smithii TaxID=174621 RepID=UPI002467C741|nr:probable serine/threonine-protein kinase DDB_G0282963 [Wyeomyia smithii]
MGWFSADEIIAPVTNTNSSERNETAIAVAACVLAAVAVSYIAVKLLAKLHRQQTERFRKRYKTLKEKATECLEILQGNLEDTTTSESENSDSDEIQMAAKLDLSLALKVVSIFTGDCAELGHFLETVDLLKAYSENVPETALLTFLRTRLTRASHGVIEKAKSIDEAKKILKDKFSVRITPKAVENELNQMKQTNKTFSEFGAEIEKLATKLASAQVSNDTFATEAAAANIVQPIAVQAFVNGLKNHQTAFFLKARNPGTLTKAISDALEVNDTSDESIMWIQPRFRRYNNNPRGNWRGRGRGFRVRGGNRGRGQFYQNQGNPNNRNNYQRGNYNQGNNNRRFNNNNNNNENNDDANNRNNDRGRQQNNRHANMAEQENGNNEEVNVANLFRE